MRTYHKNGIRKKRFHKAIPEAVTKKDAENFMNIFKADLLRGRLELIEEIGTNKFNDIIELYIKYVQTNLRSKQAAIGYALSFSKLWDNKQIKDITPAEIEKFKQKRLETVWCIKMVGREKVPQYITASTINRQLNVLSKIFSLAIDNGYLRENPE